MAQRADVVSVDINGTTFEGWTKYEIDSDLLTPADAFELEVPLRGTLEQRRAILDLFPRYGREQEATSGLRCHLYVARTSEDGRVGARALQLTGIIDKLPGEGDRGGEFLRLTGRDNGGLLTTADADPGLGVTAETTLVEAVEAVTSPYGIRVITEAAPSRFLMSGAASARDSSRLIAAHARSAGIPREQARRELAQRRSLERRTRSAPLDESLGSSSSSRASARARRGHAGAQTGSDVERVRLQDAKPQVGEAVWEFIDRHCRRFGVLPWIDAEGRLILSSPDYDQEPLYRFHRRLRPQPGEPNNIVQGGFVQNWGELSSECTVYGRARGDDATRSPFHARVENPRQPFFRRPIVIHDPSVRSAEEARRRALRELNKQNAQAYQLEYMVHGHGQGDLLYAIDTVAEVVDEAVDVDGIFYVCGRTFQGRDREGEFTRVRLVPLHSIEI